MDYLYTNTRATKSNGKIVEDLVKDIVTDEKKNAAIRMIESGKLTLDEIAEYLDLPIDIIKALSSELQPA